MQFGPSLADEDAFRRLVASIRGVAPGPPGARTDGQKPPVALGGRSPYRGLAAFDVDDWEYFFGREMLGQRSIMGALGSDPNQGRRLILVDQFEEIFTQCEKKEVREAVIKNLLCSASDPTGKVILLLCVRADFYENCLKIPELREWMPRDQTEPAGQTSNSSLSTGPAFCSCQCRVVSSEL